MVSLGGLTGGLAGGATVAITISAVDNFSKTFLKAQTSSSKLGKTLNGIGTAAVVGLTAVATAASAIGLASVKSFNSIEEGFAKVNTLLDDGEDANKIYAESVRKLSDELGVQGGQLGVLDGLYQTISAGISDTADAELFLTEAAKSAVGGSAQLSTVIEAGTKTMAAFGIETKDSGKVFDVFAGTVKAGQTTMSQLASAFPTVSGSAAEMGMSLEETAGIFAGLTKTFASPEMAATSLNAILTGLIKPTDTLKDTLKELGYESGQVGIEQVGLMELLKQLNETTGGSTEKMGELFGNVRALRGIFPALGTAAEDVAASIDIISNSSGLAQKQFDDMAETNANAMTRLKNSTDSAFNAIGAVIAPALQPGIEAVTKFMNAIDTEKVREFFVDIIETGKGVWESMLPTIETVSEVLKKMFDALTPLGIELFEGIVERGSKLWKKFSNFIKENEPLLTLAFENIVAALQVVIDTFFALYDAVEEVISDNMPQLQEFLVTVLEEGKKAWENLQPIIQTFKRIFVAFMDKVLPPVTEFLQTIVEKGSELWGKFADLIKRQEPNLKIAFEAIGDAVGYLFDFLGDVFGIFTDIVSWLDSIGFFDMLIWGFTQVAKGVKDLLAVFAEIPDYLRFLWSKFEAFMDLLGNAFSAIGLSFKLMWESMVLGLKTGINIMLTLVESMINKIIDSINWVIKAGVKVANSLNPLARLKASDYTFDSMTIAKLDTSGNESKLEEYQKEGVDLLGEIATNMESLLTNFSTFKLDLQVEEMNKELAKQVANVVEETNQNPYYAPNQSVYNPEAMSNPFDVQTEGKNTIIINIETLAGVAVDEIAEALQEKLETLI